MLSRKQVNRIRYRSKRKRKAVLAKCNNKCIYCPSTENLTIEHLTPIVKGGRHNNENLAISCYTCNQDKGQMTHEEYLTFIQERCRLPKRVDFPAWFDKISRLFLSGGSLGKSLEPLLRGRKENINGPHA